MHVWMLFQTITYICRTIFPKNDFLSQEYLSWKRLRDGKSIGLHIFLLVFARNYWKRVIIKNRYGEKLLGEK